MKKSKKLARLKRVSVCCGCKYFNPLPECEGLCARYYNIYPFSKLRDHFVNPFQKPCPHYVPFNDVMCPRKTPYYWYGSVDDDYIPF